MQNDLHKIRNEFEDDDVSNLVPLACMLCFATVTRIGVLDAGCLGIGWLV